METYRIHTLNYRLDSRPFPLKFQHGVPPYAMLSYPLLSYHIPPSKRGKEDRRGETARRYLHGQYMICKPEPQYNYDYGNDCDYEYDYDL